MYNLSYFDDLENIKADILMLKDLTASNWKGNDSSESVVFKPVSKGAKERL